MATMREIAEKTGVSRWTVSRVLNGKAEESKINTNTAARILQTAKSLNYSADDMARSIKTGRANNIGVICNKAVNSKIFEGLLTSISEKSYSLQLIPNDHDLLGTIIKKRVSAVAILSEIPALAALIEKLNALKIPCITSFESSLKNAHNWNAISSDNFSGAELAAQYLYELGHRRFICIGSHQQSEVDTMRTNCFSQWLNKQNDCSIKTICKHSAVNFNYSYHKQKLKELMVNCKNRASAIFCSSHTRAVIALSALYDIGLKVPDDVSLMAYGDSSLLKELTPPISCIAEHNYEIGLEIGEKLMEFIKHPQEKPLRKFHRVKLIRRKSCTEPNTEA